MDLAGDIVQSLATYLGLEVLGISTRLCMMYIHVHVHDVVCVIHPVCHLLSGSGGDCLLPSADDRAERSSGKGVFQHSSAPEFCCTHTLYICFIIIYLLSLIIHSSISSTLSVLRQAFRDILGGGGSWLSVAFNQPLHSLPDTIITRI